MSMTAPVITQAALDKSAYTRCITPSASTSPWSTYQQNPPLSDYLHVQPWNQTYVAVRQFGGYVTDDAAKKETAALMASLNGTRWIEPIEESKGELPEYLFAGYIAPFEIIGRVNEIWVPFNL